MQLRYTMLCEQTPAKQFVTATVSLLSDGRFTLGLGAGENLNEHVIEGRAAAGARPRLKI
jgi:alkanesulfonate monooxygenase SsuD/methylene tetrahydromethanopterin reductase-like flavin-dependent oxidoreductase (luciferase family)